MTATNDSAPCASCGGLRDPLSRQATQNDMGPWFIRDEKNPFRPGCSYARLAQLAARGKLAPDAVIRGPTTRQFWRVATKVPGLSHIYGVCHSCAAPTATNAAACVACGASFEVDSGRSDLGLSPVWLIPGQATPDQIVEHAHPPSTPRVSVVPRPVPVHFAGPRVPSPSPSGLSPEATKLAAAEARAGMWRTVALFAGVGCALLLAAATVLAWLLGSATG
ncbi:MAG: hypothetical protein SFZ23_03730 [Planctomycetota bacterium]|nr:hypothetical protein [Planctomycetota bacterium]